jgi:Dipeptidyl peptidase IV (DPP IV) N-terminal region
MFAEEVLGSNDAMWFSPDGSKLAFATFDDTSVKIMSFPYYGQADNLSFQYSVNINIHYPKVSSIKLKELILINFSLLRILIFAARFS